MKAFSIIAPNVIVVNILVWMN